MNFDTENKLLASRIIRLTERASQGWPKRKTTKEYRQDKSGCIGTGTPLKGSWWEIEKDPLGYKSIFTHTVGDIPTTTDPRTMGYRPKIEQLGFPVCKVEVSRFKDLEAPATTPYGVLPHWVLSPDGQFYYFGNTFWLSPSGRSVKVESISLYKTETPLDLFLISIGATHLDNVPRIDFIPSIADRRHVPLGLGDYEKLHGTLDMIQRGQMKLRGVDP